MERDSDGEDACGLGRPGRRRSRSRSPAAGAALDGRGREAAGSENDSEIDSEIDSDFDSDGRSGRARGRAGKDGRPPCRTGAPPPPPRQPPLFAARDKQPSESVSESVSESESELSLSEPWSELSETRIWFVVSASPVPSEAFPSHYPSLPFAPFRVTVRVSLPRVPRLWRQRRRRQPAALRLPARRERSPATRCPKAPRAVRAVLRGAAGGLATRSSAQCRLRADGRSAGRRFRPRCPVEAMVVFAFLQKKYRLDPSGWYCDGS